MSYHLELLQPDSMRHDILWTVLLSGTFLDTYLEVTKKSKKKKRASPRLKSGTTWKCTHQDLGRVGWPRWILGWHCLIHLMMIWWSDASIFFIFFLWELYVTMSWLVFWCTHWTSIALADKSLLTKAGECQGTRGIHRWIWASKKAVWKWPGGLLGDTAETAPGSNFENTPLCGGLRVRSPECEPSFSSPS